MSIAIDISVKNFQLKCQCGIKRKLCQIKLSTEEMWNEKNDLAFWIFAHPMCVLCRLLWNLHTETIYIIYFLLFEYVRDMRSFNAEILVQACVSVHALSPTPAFPLNSHCFLFFISGVVESFFYYELLFFFSYVRVEYEWCQRFGERTKCGLNYFNISMMVLLFPLSVVLNWSRDNKRNGCMYNLALWIAAREPRVCGIVKFNRRSSFWLYVSSVVLLLPLFLSPTIVYAHFAWQHVCSTVMKQIKQIIVMRFIRKLKSFLRFYLFLFYLDAFSFHGSIRVCKCFVGFVADFSYSWIVNVWWWWMLTLSKHISINLWWELHSIWWPKRKWPNSTYLTTFRLYK